MRALLQRVSQARVLVAGEVVGQVGPGLLVLLGVARTDGEEDMVYLAQRLPHLRLFPTPAGHFERSALEVGAQVLLVSQFTLYAETRKGRRPSFAVAAPAEQARPLVEGLAAALQAAGLQVETGRFGALMRVELVNEGPVTLLIDSADRQRSRRSVETGT